MTKVDPIKLAKELWPDTYFYREQKEIIRSVWENDETVVPAGNMLGKDYVSGRIVVLYFLTHRPCRIITTSAKDDHLRVMWGEIGDAIKSSSKPLIDGMGGPFICTHREIRRKYKGEISPICYVKGMVASTDSIASLQGHHAKYTLFISDESSSVMNEYFRMANGWAKRKLILGNPWNCSNYFFTSVEGDPASQDKGGDIPDPHRKGRYYRKVIRIAAEASPNVRLGLAEVKAGKEPSHEVLVPGVKTYAEYLKNRMLWDPYQQCVSLDAKFYRGKEVLLFPEDALRRSIRLARELANKPRRAKKMGVDSAEGGDSTVWTIIDEVGIIYQQSQKTADTSDIPGTTIGLMKEYRLDPQDVLFDRGGGGKQHADQIRRRGYDVLTVGFGEAAGDPHKDRKTTTIRPPVPERVQRTEYGYAYKNRRAEMYGMASLMICGEKGFAIPVEYTETLRQLKHIPKKYDGEGRLYLPPKEKPNPKYIGETLRQILGRSPDEADSLVLAIYGLSRVKMPVTAGVM